MAITLYPVTPTFAAEVGDVDLSRPLSAEDDAAIKEAFWKYSVLVFPDQDLAEAQQIAFAETFGPVEVTSRAARNDLPLRISDRLADISNLTHEGETWAEQSRGRLYALGNRLWHTDSSFKRLPSLCSLLYARTIAPVGGHTEFADQRAAYDALDEATRQRLAGLVAEHSIFTSRGRLGFTDFDPEDREKLPPVPQALVRTIPQTGRKTLYVASHAGRVFGMPEAEGRALIDGLIAHVSQRQFVYTHRWRAGDLVMWDNRCTMHRGTDYDDLRWKRDARRATVQDVANSCEQEGLELPT